MAPKLICIESKRRRLSSGRCMWWRFAMLLVVQQQIRVCCGSIAAWSSLPAVRCSCIFCRGTSIMVRKNRHAGKATMLIGPWLERRCHPGWRSRPRRLPR
ncbi:hypothetical protein CONLIGDRAFT_122205 [Coniochaeta ligniaria NRRL 30616]|uniref:Uncharacterized protein n=1 Tax=Coniochaeta ligniaria NRRL 30616 TaxID=1408157 RepID=A0A1J7I9A2_9PEZI|nr:hypothetical protein CONLIGDRAFT_122205 [Coniochaeta ligniaria NRRL 30616]